MDVLTFEPRYLSMDELQPLHAALDPDFNAKQREFAEIVYSGLMTSPLSQSCSTAEIATIAVAVLLQCSHVLGGQTYYFNSLGHLQTAKMRRSILSKFKGNNHLALAREHGVSEVRIRQILKEKKPT